MMSLFVLLVARNGECILDVGCGDGVLTAELKARGCTVVGIDFAPNMVAAAIKRVSAARSTTCGCSCQSEPYYSQNSTAIHKVASRCLTSLTYYFVDVRAQNVFRLEKALLCFALLLRL